MKIIFTLSCFLLLSICVQAQATFNSSCIPSGNMAAIYRNDAYMLALKRVNDINSPWKDSVNIPEIYIDSITRAMYAIQNMDYSPIRDTITTLFGFDGFNATLFPSDSLHIKNPGDWNYSFRMKSITVRGDLSSPLINDLINRYNLTVTAATPGYLVTSPVAINTTALKDQFAAINGVTNAEHTYSPGSGNTMTYNVVNGEVFLSYNLGCGDCLLGCTYGRTWNFKVHTNTDCSVEYISANDWGMRVLLPEFFPLCTPTITPIELTSIHVSQGKNFQLVEWKMSMEDNVVSYSIERSADAVNYNSIGKINVTQSSSVPINYSWKDNEPLNGKIYYRIKITDRTGAKKYSPTASLTARSESSIRVFPTIVRNNSINIQFNKVDKGLFTVELLNTSGQKLFSTGINVNSPSFTTPLNIPGLASGMYILLVSGKTVQAKQMVYISN